MSRTGKKLGKKGRYTKFGLPFAKQYVQPQRKGKTAGIFISFSLLVSLTAFIYHQMADEHFFSSGPLSSFHAKLEDDCAACHTSFKPVSNAKCESCHTKPDDENFYRIESHFAGKPTQARLLEVFAHKEDCAACHLEHLGRQANISEPHDSECISCHQFGSFNSAHPEFAFARNKLRDSGTLQFSHSQHVEILSSGELSKSAAGEACKQCHNPANDFNHFEPINYAKHCSDCHLPIKRAARDDVVHRDAIVLKKLSTIKAALERLAQDRKMNPARVRLQAMGLLKQAKHVAEACIACHTIPEAQILPVQKDQRVFTKADFNHKPHVLLAQCLDCHNKLPITKELQKEATANQASDISTVINIPEIETCQQCHGTAGVADKCVTCHDFHPR